MPAARPPAPARCWATRRRPCCWPPSRAGSPDATTRRRKPCAPSPAARTRRSWVCAGCCPTPSRARIGPRPTLARQAEAAHPGAAWLRQERTQLAIRAGDWAEALTLAGPEGPRAALAVGAAQVEPNPDKAEKLARQALRNDPAFTPAVLAVATKLRMKGKEKQVRAVLTEGWKRNPHPDIAAFAMAPVNDKQARAQVAKDLTAGMMEHPESQLLLARTALEAGMVASARQHLESARRMGLNQRRAWLLLAEIEEEEHGATEEGRLAQRDALLRAATADPDPEWRCAVCHTPQPSWRPACPACQAPGSLIWVAEGGVGTGGNAETVAHAAA